jgi:hypothetical protein
MYPQVVGHEIVGEVLRVGDKVDKSIKVGDIVGVGAQCDSCQDCTYCDKGGCFLLPPSVCLPLSGLVLPPGRELFIFHEIDIRSGPRLILSS